LGQDNLQRNAGFLSEIRGTFGLKRHSANEHRVCDRFSFRESGNKTVKSWKLELCVQPRNFAGKIVTRFTSTIVMIDKNGKPATIPPDVRTKLLQK
jgi:hypothetical protein